MRIVFLGNMNNLTFYPARELKKRGFDVTFIVDADKKNLLDRPESWDKTLINAYPDWIKEMVLPDSLKAFKFSVPLIYLKKYIRLINEYDVVFLNGFWISLAQYIRPGKKVVAIFAGYDLDVLADYNYAGYLANGFYQASSGYAKIIPHFIPQLFFKKVIGHQRQGIKRADVVNYYSTGINPEADALLNDIKAGQTFKRLEYRGFDCDKFPYREPVMGNKKFTILNITRFFYLTKRNDNKRNDIMIKGIGNFLKTNQLTPADVDILFFEKGDDIADAKRLCDQYGLTPFISWQQQTSAEDLNDYFARCDVAFDQLGDQWVGAGLFSMLTGRPVIANGRPEVFEKLFNEKSPVCQASNEQEVANWLIRLYTERHLLKEIGLASRNYVLKHYSIETTVDYYIKNLGLQ